MKIGIWIDKEKAHIVRLSGENEEFETISSGLEFFHPRGGSRTRNAKWGPQDVVQDSKYLEREKHQLKEYFNKLADALGDAQAIALFGPADTYEKFKSELLANHRSIGQKIITASRTDSMTKNQIRALVRDYFQPKHQGDIK